MTKLIDNLSKITSISKQTFDKLTNLSVSCICDSIEDDILNNESIATIDIGIGQLLIKHTDNDMRYKFIPDAKLEEAVSQTIVNDKNPLKVAVEDTLKKRILNIYKELL